MAVINRSEWSMDAWVRQAPPESHQPRGAALSPAAAARIALAVEAALECTRRRQADTPDRS